jgi:hypothetical protein
MTIPDADAHAIASFRKFYKLLPQSDDATLVILKLHLLVEEQIRAFVDERLNHADALESAELKCHQVICLAEALSTEDIHSNVWEAARKLNKLRNDIAHKLEPTGVMDRMNHISSLIGLPPEVMRIDGKTPAAAATENLSFAVSVLYNEIALFVKRKPAQVLSLATARNDD